MPAFYSQDELEAIDKARREEYYLDDDGEQVNEYGNPVSGDSMPYCQMPDCGCPEPRLCMAEGGWGSRYGGELR